jgi:hypothetical protein
VPRQLLYHSHPIPSSRYQDDLCAHRRRRYANPFFAPSIVNLSFIGPQQPVDNNGEDDIEVRISVPGSAVGHDFTILVSPRRGRTAVATAVSPPSPSPSPRKAASRVPATPPPTPSFRSGVSQRTIAARRGLTAGSPALSPEPSPRKAVRHALSPNTALSSPGLPYPSTRATSPPGVAADASSGVSSTDDDPFLTSTSSEYVPHHLRLPANPNMSIAERYGVSAGALCAFPPDPNSVGWKYQAWYVVYKGRDIGIFYDFWYVLYSVHNG